MDKEKEIRLPESLFRALLCYHLAGMEEYAPVIQEGLNAKLEALVTHDLYTKSKTAKSPEEREAARQAYLDKRGISKDFRWSFGQNGNTVR